MFFVKINFKKENWLELGIEKKRADNDRGIPHQHPRNKKKVDSIYFAFVL